MLGTLVKPKILFIKIGGIRNMLVLSRKVCEKIKLGDSITLTIVKVSGDKVRLGIEAPADVKVLRDELERYPEEPQTLQHPSKLLIEADLRALPLAS
jgi:carbon storage regulator